MKPKSREDILNICWSNFYNYSTLSKLFIITSVILSAATIAFYICRYIFPTIHGIVYGDIVGWDILWRCCFVYLLHYVVMFINLIFVSIGGSAMCREENWDTKDFAIAWTNMYE
jgi:hypothetical protein